MEKMTVTALATQIPTEADAYILVESLRWNGRVICPHCGSVDGAYYLRPLNGISRKTRTGTESQRRVWKCAGCRKQFSATTGTVMHGSKVPLRIWLFVIFEMCANKNGIAAREIECKYGVASRTAWFMTHRLREAMKRRTPNALLSGIVVSDETCIGGDPKNWHASKREGGAQGKTDKTPVMSLVDAAARG